MGHKGDGMGRERQDRQRYRAMVQELNEKVQPKLYYPQTDVQQRAICEHARHCFFVDKDTQVLKYINSRGTIISLPNTTLQSRAWEQVKSAGLYGDLIYKDPMHDSVSKYALKKIRSKHFGPGLQLHNDCLDVLLPLGVPEDPIITMTQETLKTIHYGGTYFRRVLTLFSDHWDPFLQDRIVGLLQIKEILAGKPTRDIYQMSRRPQASDFMGEGDNAYVFFDDPDSPKKSEFWYVDRSSYVPVLTRFPMNTVHGEHFRHLFHGAKGEPEPDPKHWYSKDYWHYNDAVTWHELGKEAKLRHNNPQKCAMELSKDAAKKIPELLLSDIKPYRHMFEDWSYHEASNGLTHALETMTITRENDLFRQRCTQIHALLNVIGNDVYGAFPKSRGVVPPAKRQKIIEMLAAQAENPASPEAKHYLRTKHRVYHEKFLERNISRYEPGSFVWDNDDKIVHYIDENRKSIDVPMTSSIRKKFQVNEIEAGVGAATHISTRDVYNLMTRPGFFSFVFESSLYYTPWRPDRSKDFHTGTAQEMLYEIHDMKLSTRAILCHIGKIVMFAVVPTVISFFGLTLPLLAFLGIEHIYFQIYQWAALVWNLDFTFRCLKAAVLKNDLVSPELTQLDQLLGELHSDVPTLQHPPQPVVLDERHDPRETEALLSAPRL
ncbi:MAG: hypothetical protein NXI01_06585 [Gammaproteobacteria bacterium]|nr:hypothetical protein [Gammaproteobacteria bacterium]